METAACKESSSSLLPLWNWERMSFFQNTWILQGSYCCLFLLMLVETKSILHHAGGTFTCFKFVFVINSLIFQTVYISSVFSAQIFQTLYLLIGLSAC